ncbi:hypothetical protein AOQ84DRAFT_375681 [Glonium stellatum]|uniref:Uncharacterized protein n=1 Tax=Glonium stellatum TaxID=574774 RepID=A0A8E2F2Z7_9PEZI|nr:hypothetical protein AOQ84DRAFT_375681 [Glonium stellatum]
MLTRSRTSNWDAEFGSYTYQHWLKFESYVHQHWSDFSGWLSQPHVLAVIIAWSVTFTIVVTLVMCLGFGRGGVIAGSLAAVCQSFMYGAFTPAGGIFATLTSMAMLGTLMPWGTLLAAIMATLVVVAMLLAGMGR